MSLGKLPGILCDEPHGFSAAGTRPRRLFGGRSRGLIVADKDRHAGHKLDALALLLCGRMEEPVMAHGVHLGREDVAEVAADELDAIDFERSLDVAVIAIFPAEGDGVVAGGNESAVGDGGAGDVSAKVFDGRCARAAGLDVDAPLLRPHDGMNGPIAHIELAAEGLFEGGLEHGNVDEIVSLFDGAKRAVSAKSRVLLGL